MSEKEKVFPIPIDKISKLHFDGKTGELCVDGTCPHPIEGDIPFRIMFSQEATQALALNLARTHKFLDEQLEGIKVTNVLQ